MRTSFSNTDFSLSTYCSFSQYGCILKWVVLYNKQLEGEVCIEESYSSKPRVSSRDCTFDRDYTFSRSCRAHTSAFAFFSSVTCKFSGGQITEITDFKEHPDAAWWWAHLLLALMAVCAARLITVGVFRDEGRECNLSSALMGLFP